MPNDDYIKRSDAIKALYQGYEKLGLIVYRVSCIEKIDKIPAADVEPVRHGKWIKSPEYPEEYDICSICGLNDKHRTRADQEHPAFESLPPYCPNCGAKMNEEL